MSQILFTLPARQDLAEIYRHIASDNITAADKHRQILRQRCLGLVDHPRAGTKRDNIRPGLRSVTEGDYVIFYRIVGDDNVVIMRVVHCKRDLGTITFAE